MRAVVYDRKTMEPLTVIHLRWQEVRVAKRNGGRLRLAVHSPLVVPADPYAPPIAPDHHAVELLVEPLYRGGKRCGDLVTTTTPETALLLDAVFCAGQYTELVRRNVRLDA